MKTFGFKISKEKNFVHITCNIILSFLAIVTFCFCLFMPSSVAVVTSSGNGAIYYGNKQGNKVSLMINVYWGEEYLQDMLNTLKENEVHATFFVGGSWVAKNSEKFLQIVEEGHEIGNHGYNHKDHVKISNELAKKEIKLTQDVVFSLCGITTTLFAPPSGSVNKNVCDLAGGMGYKTIMWSKDTIDWRDKDEDLIFSRATKNVTGGDLILMHPTKATVSALGKIINEIKNKGLEIATVSENLQNTF